MWYITVAFFLSLFSVFEFAKRKVGRNVFFNIAWIILTFMLVFRYGQGTDYYAYYLIYQNIDSTGSFFVNALAHGEIGWYMLNLAANKMGMSFFVFIGIVSLIEMLLVRRFIEHYSPYGSLSLLLFYPTYFLTACFSTIRQGLVLCVFLGLCVDCLVEKKYRVYYLLIVCLVFIHTSAVVLLAVPFFVNYKINRYYIFCSVLLAVAAFFVANRYSVVVVESYSGYMGGAVMAGFLVRLLLFYIIWRLHKLYNSECRNDLIERILFRVYILGFALFLFLVQSSTLSQRLTMPFKAVEIVLLPILIFKNRVYFSNIKKKVRVTFTPIVFYLVVLIMNIEFVKNIYSYLDQGNYYSWVTPIDYPYSSVFNQDAIRNYISNFDEEEY